MTFIPPKPLLPVDQTEYLKEVQFHMRHINNDYDYHIQIMPMPTPRARGKVMNNKFTGKPFVHMYNPTEYTRYMESIAGAVQQMGITPGKYNHIAMSFVIPYPATRPNKYKIDGAKHVSRPDYDNYCKAVGDSLQKSGVLIEDGSLSDGLIKKRYTVQPFGWISFNIM